MAKFRLSSLIRRVGRDTRGNALILAGTGMFALIGGAGLGTDTIQWFLWKRQLQQAVESGALAGTHGLWQNSSQVTTLAKREVSRNANTAVTVEAVNAPPAAGAYTADTSAVEVIATTSAYLPFSGMFLSAAPVVRARAVAAFVKEGEHCVISLASTGVGVNVAGSSNVQLGCGVAANSAGTQAIYMEGSSYLSGSPLSTVGGITAAESNYSSSTQLNPYGPAQVDPVLKRNLSVPTSPSGCTANALEVAPSQTTTLSPGRYCGGMTLKGNVTLQPGVYIVDQGLFNVTSQATLSGEGVTIVLTGSDSSNIAAVQIDGGATLNLKAPTAVQSSTWKNVLFFQDPRGSTKMSYLAGGSTMKMSGIVYMPKGNLSFNGGSEHTSDCLLMVGHRVTFTGSSKVDNVCPSDMDDFSGRRIRIVE